MNDPIPEKLKIEHGVAIPQRRGGSRWDPLINQMKEGDSIFFERSYDGHCFCAQIRKRGLYGIGRATEERGRRVWLVDEKTYYEHTPRRKVKSRKK